MIGLSRNIKLPWLAEAARLRAAVLTTAECKSRLTEYLSHEIASPTNLRKTREILMRVWIYDDEPNLAALRESAMILQKNFADALPIHWSLLLAAYPIFARVNKIIGRLFELREVITPRRIREKLFDELGERSTLYYSAEKILATLRNFGVLTNEKPGELRLIRREVTDEKITALLIRAAMTADGGSYFTLREAENFAVLYPFRFRVTWNLFADEKIFTVTNIGGERVVMLINR